MIRLGICTEIEHAEEMKQIGYDYIELALSRTAMLSDGEFEELLEKAGASPLPVEAMNSMMPWNVKICRPEGVSDEVRAYLESALKRASMLGAKIVVFGAGASRSVPEGMSREDALSCLTEFLKTAGRIAEVYGITIAVEPLRAEETNIIHYVSEAQSLAKRADMPNVKTLADLYHMMCGNDSMDALKNGVVHCHIAERRERLWPAAGDGSECDYREFIGALKAAAYDGRISVEGKGPEDFEDAARKSFEILTELIRE